MRDRESQTDNRQRQASFLFPKSPDRLWESTQLPIQWIPGALSPGVKTPGHEDDQSSPTTTADVEVFTIYSCPPFNHFTQ